MKNNISDALFFAGHVCVIAALFTVPFIGASALYLLIIGTLLIIFGEAIHG